MGGESAYLQKFRIRLNFSEVPANASRHDIESNVGSLAGLEIQEAYTNEKLSYLTRFTKMVKGAAGLSRYMPIIGGSAKADLKDLEGSKGGIIGVLIEIKSVGCGVA